MEAALLALGETEDLAALKLGLQPAMEHDTMLKVCFSEGTLDPGAALRSYLTSLISEIGEGLLWLPQGQGGDR